MKALLFYLLVVGVPAMAGARGEIVQIKRPLRMSEAEPMQPQDFYLNLGTVDGLKEGDLLEVSRSYPVVDRAGMPGPLMRVRLGELRVVVVSESTSLARVSKERAPASLPALDSSSFALGDEVAPAGHPEDRTPEKTELPSK